MRCLSNRSNSDEYSGRKRHAHFGNVPVIRPAATAHDAQVPELLSEIAIQLAELLGVAFIQVGMALARCNGTSGTVIGLFLEVPDNTTQDRLILTVL